MLIWTGECSEFKRLPTQRKPPDRPNVGTSARPLSTRVSHLSALSGLIVNVPPPSIFGSTPAGVHAALRLLIRCQMWVWCHWRPVPSHPASPLRDVDTETKQKTLFTHFSVQVEEGSCCGGFVWIWMKLEQDDDSLFTWSGGNNSFLQPKQNHNLSWTYPQATFTRVLPHWHRALVPWGQIQIYFD